ncbi:MAG: hypothetical protein AB1331_07950 [Bacillota bacterium]
MNEADLVGLGPWQRVMEGQDYYLRGAVRRRVIYRECLGAQVQGLSDHYWTIVDLRGPTLVHCDCSSTQLCRHAFGILWAYVREQQSFTPALRAALVWLERPPLKLAECLAGRILHGELADMSTSEPPAGVSQLEDEFGQVREALLALPGGKRDRYWETAVAMVARSPQRLGTRLIQTAADVRITAREAAYAARWLEARMIEAEAEAIWEGTPRDSWHTVNALGHLAGLLLEIAGEEERAKTLNQRRLQAPGE